MAGNAIARAPGPRGLDVLRRVAALRRDPLRALLAARADLGDVVRFPLLHRSFFLVAHPEGVDHVLHANAANYRKCTRTYRKIRELMGDGLVTSEGTGWRRQRDLVQPAFRHQQIDRFAAVVARNTAELVDRWSRLPDHQPTPLEREIRHLTLRTVGHTLLGQEVGTHPGSTGAAIVTALAYSGRRAEALLDPWRLPTPARRAFIRARSLLDVLVARLIDERASRPAEPDLLSMLLDARDPETGEGLCRAEIRDQVLTILLAGHETTATALVWTCFLLSEHPAVQERLAAEAAAVLAGRPAEFSDLVRLRYTRMVLEESMRLFPPIWMVERRCTEADEIGGFHIPAGSIVALSQYVTHRHPDVWEEPERFRPERFRPERARGRPRGGYFPFGGGPRGCIGAGFAMMEAQLILAMLCERFRLEPVSGQRVQTRGGITLRPRRHLWLHLRHRRPAAAAARACPVPAGAVSTPAARTYSASAAAPPRCTGSRGPHRAR